MPKTIFHPALKVITKLIEGQQIAKSDPYKIVWNKDHFEIHSIHKLDTQSYLITELSAKDINEGLSCAKWNTIESRLRVLIETGVIK